MTEEPDDAEASATNGAAASPTPKIVRNAATVTLIRARGRASSGAGIACDVGSGLACDVGSGLACSGNTRRCDVGSGLMWRVGRRLMTFLYGPG